MVSQHTLFVGQGKSQALCVGCEGGRWSESQWLAGWEKERVEGGTVVLFKTKPRKQEAREVGAPEWNPLKTLQLQGGSRQSPPPSSPLVSWLSSPLTQF